MTHAPRRGYTRGMALNELLLVTGRRVLVLAIAATAVTGCAQRSLSPDVYSRDDAGRIHSNEFGEVVELREVPIEGRSSVIGTYGGGYVGAAAGGAVGDGAGQDIAEAVGAVAGAVVGQRAEEAATRTDGLEITVRLDSGRLITIVQGADVAFVEGERVRVMTAGNGRGRIVKY